MITLHRNTKRHYLQRGEISSWLTFHRQDQAEPPVDGFGVLATLNEVRFPPGGGSAPPPLEETEIVTYVRRGALAQEDSTGNASVIRAGEFQRKTIARGVHHKETNASRTCWVHLFRIALRPSEIGLAAAQEQKRFTAAQRHNTLCVVASPDERRGSLRIFQDVLILSSVLDPGHHLLHELLPGRSAWLHVISGEVTLSNLILAQGDGVGVTVEPSVSLTAQENTEILLVDVGPGPESPVRQAVP